MKNILIDGDVVAYKIAFACQTNVDFGDIIHSHVNKEDVKRQVDNYVKKIILELATILHPQLVTLTMIAFSGPSDQNFRKKVLSTYKGNRKENPKPLALSYIKDYIQTNYKNQYRAIANLEADDLLAMAATKMSDTIIVSVDKDFLTIPCTIYNPDTRLLEQVSEDDADYNFMIQVLSGDQVDGYTGIPGVGRKTAEKILEEGAEGCDARWDTVVEAYKKKGLTEGNALVQARCARLLRWGDYDFLNNEVQLWQPCKTSVG